MFVSIGKGFQFSVKCEIKLTYVTSKYIHIEEIYQSVHS